MAVERHQMSPVDPLPLVLGVVRTRNVAASIATFCPSHAAHYSPVDVGWRRCSWRCWMAIMPSIR